MIENEGQWGKNASETKINILKFIDFKMMKKLKQGKKKLALNLQLVFTVENLKYPITSTCLLLAVFVKPVDEW